MPQEYHTTCSGMQHLQHVMSMDRRPPLRGNRRMDTWRTRMRRRRKLLGVTQEQLGETLGVGQSVITMWETGRRYPEGEDTFERLAEALRCNAAWLRYGVGDPTPADAEIAARLAALSDADRAAVLALVTSLTTRRTAG